MKKRSALLLLLPLGLTALSCRQPPEARDLTSLRRSGDVTFVCIGPGRVGAPLSFCPQGGRADDLGLTVGNEGYSLHALVTQTLSGEVAVVRVASPDTGDDSKGKVLDVDGTNPGVTPLRVGEQPADIVTTPGGRASFVGVAQVGLEGVYALPTQCVLSPTAGEPPRDRTTWPACSLSSAPGDMTVLVDTAEVEGAPRQFCGAPPPSGLPRASEDYRCTADLSAETLSPGARKLLVALPEEGRLVVLDAQEILTRQPGSYEPCHIEAELPLGGDVPNDILQPLPSDLRETGASTWVTYDELGGSYASRPAGMAKQDEVVLIADQSAPLIHRVDTSDACSPIELAPLFATSFNEPARVVTTSEIAVSPISPSGARFAYAVDEVGSQRSSIMVFDLSPGAESRAPLLRSGAPLLPFEAPDRIEFATGVKDVGFALLDRSRIDPATGVATSGVLCDPDPDTPRDAPGALYRPSSGTSGAGPFVMRGLFGYALLSNGGVSVIDIEDFDAACRRPLASNPSDEMDFRGCQSDDIDSRYYTTNGSIDASPTVTEEVSCRMVVPHRVRSQHRMRTTESGGVSSPALRAFGRLSQRGRGLPVSRLTPEGKRSPIILGVDFQAPNGGGVPAQVNIGSTLYARDDISNPLVIDPNEADRPSMVLPFYDPRAYPSSEVVSVIYEGQINRTHHTGELLDSSDGMGQVTLTDPSTAFCSTGVHDRRLTRQLAADKFGLTGGAEDRFVERHTDYIQVANRLYDEEDAYWQGQGASCGAPMGGENGSGFELCDSLFGRGDEEELSEARDLTVVRAENGVLELTPRHQTDFSAADHLDALRCCFPGATSYRFRAGHQWVVRGSRVGFAHNVKVDRAEGSDLCVFDESPLASRLEGRAFEVSSTFCDNFDVEDVESCGVGVRTEEDVVCAYDATKGPVEVGGVASECIFDGLTRRFVVYRGLEPSTRDMAFGWEVIGGFRNQVISLVQNTSVVLPASLVEVPTFGALGIVDSQNRGLMMVDLANSHVAQSFF